MFLSILNLHIQKTQTVCWHLSEVKDVLQTPCDVFLLDFFFLNWDIKQASVTKSNTCRNDSHTSLHK